MKILIIGLGSIGQRHLINLKKIYPKAKFYALRRKNKSNIIHNTKLIKKMNLKKFYNLEIVKNYVEAQRLKADLVFICNPTSFHFKSTEIFIKKRTNVFVEKPIIQSENKIKKLNKIIKKNRVQTMVGYQLRFHPIIKLVKNIILKNKYGRVLTAEFKNLSYLPNYHPYEDYSKSYAATKKKGGGVINTSSHEIDLITYFFGKPKKIHSINIRTNLIKCDAEDLIDCNLIFKNKYSFSVNLKLSFINFIEKRSFFIYFRKAYLEVDLLKNQIKIYSNKSHNVIFNKKFKIKKNHLFLEEIKHMKDCINNNKKNFLSIDKNLATIKLINKIKNFKTLEL